MRSLFSCVLSLVVLGLASCATRSTPPPVRFTAPAQAAPVAPVVASVRTAQAETLAVSQKLETQVAVLSDKTATLQGNLISAVELADKMRREKRATEAQLEQQWQQLTAITASHLALENDITATKSTVANLRAANQAQAANIDRLAVAVNAAEAERDTLRVQHVDMQQTIDSQKAACDKLASDLRKSEASAASGNTYKWWCVGIALLIVLYLAARFLLPLILSAINPIPKIP